MALRAPLRLAAEPAEDNALVLDEAHQKARDTAQLQLLYDLAESYMECPYEQIESWRVAEDLVAKAEGIERRR